MPLSLSDLLLVLLQVSLHLEASAAQKVVVLEEVMMVVLEDCWGCSNTKNTNEHLKIWIFYMLEKII